MEQSIGQRDAPESVTSEAIRRELAEVMAAIRLVTAGDASRVLVSNIAFGDQLLARARAVAAGRGLMVEAIWHADDRGCDLRVSRAVTGAVAS